MIHDIIRDDNLEPSNDGIDGRSRSLFADPVALPNSHRESLRAAGSAKGDFAFYLVEDMKLVRYGRYRPGKSREKTLRKRLIAKKGKKCELCNYSGYIEMHHVERVVDGGDHTEENCVLLCEKCHAKAHGYKKKKYIDRHRENWNGKGIK